MFPLPPAPRCCRCECCRCFCCCSVVIKFYVHICFAVKIACKETEGRVVGMGCEASNVKQIAHSLMSTKNRSVIHQLCYMGVICECEVEVQLPVKVSSKLWVRWKGRGEGSLVWCDFCSAFMYNFIFMSMAVKWPNGIGAGVANMCLRL